MADKEANGETQAQDSPFDSIDSNLGKQVMVCNGNYCGKNGKGVRLLAAFRREIKANGLEQEVTSNFCGCFGFCHFASNVGMMPGKIIYSRMKPEHVAELVQIHLVAGKILEDKICPDQNQTWKPKMSRRTPKKD
ncbi:ferredoxin [Planctomycetota bacterium]